MHPILLHLGPITLRTYGAFVAIAFLVGLQVARKAARLRRIDEHFFMDLAVMLVFSGLLGARVFYILLNLSYYLKHPWESVKVWEGGLVFYGGFLAASLTGWLYVRRHRIPAGTIADCFAPAVALGQSLGRWGCFFAGCCYGRPTTLPWGIQFTDPSSLAPLGVELHPVQIYEALGSAAIALLVWMRLIKSPRSQGQVFWLYVALYAGLRFTLEFWRGDDRGPMPGGLAPSQWIALAALLLSGGLLLVHVLAVHPGHHERLKITSAEEGRRLDRLLARAHPRYSRVFLQKLMRRGGVTGGGRPQLDPGYRVHAGEVFEIADFEMDSGSSDAVLAPAAARPAFDAALEPTVLFEDGELLVLSKPPGLVVHPAPGHHSATLVDWLRGYLGPSVRKVFTDPERLGLVHRLDKETSGVILVAKTVTAQTALARQFHDRKVIKTYAAFVEGVPAPRGTISAPVGRSRSRRTQMEVSSIGRPSETRFVVKESYQQEVSLVSVAPKTGRTHQIRVHMAAIGHPLVGDRTYGAKVIWADCYGITRCMLHAESLEVQHPSTDKPVRFEAPWPADFKEAQARFRQIARAAVILLALTLGLSAAGIATEAPAKTPAPGPAAPHAKHHHSPSTSETASTLRKLRKDLEALQTKVLKIEASLDALSASKRLQELDQALAELNSKSVSNSTSVEETRTQIQDVQRRLKNQQELLEQLRDQVGRLQQGSAQRRLQEEKNDEKALDDHAPGNTVPAAAASDEDKNR